MTTEHQEVLRYITVIGEAKVQVVPDQVILAVDVNTTDKELDKAKVENDKIVHQIFSLKKEVGIETKNIQTDYLRISPQYKRDDDTFTGYLVSKSITIVLNELSRFEKFLTEMLNAGVKNIDGIEFRTTELKKHRDKARVAALKAAQEKAQLLAKEVNLEIGKPISIEEEESKWWMSDRSWLFHHGRSIYSQVSIPGEGTNSAETEGAIALGQISVSAKVSVKFELE